MLYNIDYMSKTLDPGVYRPRTFLGSKLQNQA